MEQWESEHTDALFKAILSLKNAREAKKFFRDLLTEPEIKEFSKRWQAARMLNNKVPYSVIEVETRLSSATIARISNWLQNGMGGYRLILNRLYPGDNGAVKNSD